MAQADRPVPEAAAGTYDWVYRGTGNWPFNTAWAADRGLDAFVTRLYGLDNHLTHVSSLAELKASSPVTRISDSLKQMVDETADLPIGAVVLLSPGVSIQATNASGATV